MKQTQEDKVLKVLQNAEGRWVDGEYFLRDMYLSQYHRAIHTLQKHKDRYGYKGVIEASPFTNIHGFKSYRLVNPLPLFS